MNKIRLTKLFTTVLFIGSLASCVEKAKYKLVTAAGNVVCSLSLTDQPQCFRYVIELGNDGKPILPHRLHLDILGVPGKIAQSKFANIKAKSTDRNDKVRVCGFDQEKKITACWDYNGPHAFAEEVSFEKYQTFNQASISDFGNLDFFKLTQSYKEPITTFNGLCHVVSNNNQLECINTNNNESILWDFAQPIEKIIVNNIIGVETKSGEIFFTGLHYDANLKTLRAADIHKVPGVTDLQELESFHEIDSPTLNACFIVGNKVNCAGIFQDPNQPKPVIWQLTIAPDLSTQQIVSISRTFFKTTAKEVKRITFYNNTASLASPDAAIVQKTYDSFAANLVSFCAIEGGSTELRCHKIEDDQSLANELLPVP